MTKLNQESGRSMVEMLGVLAIIGVLSIGGIAGYTMAMNRFQANEVLNAASMAAILGMSANGGTGVTEATNYTSLNSGAALPSGATAISVTVTDGKPSVSITASNADVAEAMENIAGNQIECTGAEGQAATACTYTPNAN